MLLSPFSFELRLVVRLGVSCPELQLTELAISLMRFTAHSPAPNGSEPADQETRAAWLTAKHSITPTNVYLDVLGRTFQTVADNGTDTSGVEQKYETRVELDIEGNQRSVTDALKRKVMVYDYDLLGNVIHQHSMEAGERWMLNNVAGNAIRRWDRV